MKKRQLATLGLTLGLVGAVGVGGTMALLSAQSETVTNTFTVGKGLHDSDITLNEAKVDSETGKEIVGAERVQTNEYKNLEQGVELDKDPTVSIKNTAADCYVFVKIDGLKDSNGTDPSKYYDVTIDKNWIAATTKGLSGLTEEEKKDLEAKLKNVYVYDKNQDGVITKEGDVVSGGLSATTKGLSGLTEEEKKDLEAKLKNVYVYDKNQDGVITKEGDVVSGGLSGNAGLVFNGVTIKKDAPLYTYNDKNKTWEKADLPQIVVKACAVQANNVNGYTDALKAVTFE